MSTVYDLHLRYYEKLQMPWYTAQKAHAKQINDRLNSFFLSRLNTQREYFGLKIFIPKSRAYKSRYTVAKSLLIATLGRE